MLNELFAYLGENIVAERRISVAPDGQSFNLDPNGTPAMIVGVNDGEGVYDCAAYFPNDPNKWWLALGRASILGWPAIVRAVEEGHAIELVCTPQTWLRWSVAKGERFACVLNWDVKPVLNLAWVRTVRCENAALRYLLEEAVARFRAPFLIETGDDALVGHAESRHAA